MKSNELIMELRKLIAKWGNDAFAQVPSEYASRNLHYKYFKLDHRAAGLMDCADDLHELVNKLEEK